MDSVHVLFSDEGHPVAIRKWSKEPFEGGEEYVRKSDLAALIPANDAALDWADANARGFPIETAPAVDGFLAWSSIEQEWLQFSCRAELQFVRTFGNDGYTHWTPLPPPPSNPPLPAPLERLGEVLRKVKGAHG